MAAEEFCFGLENLTASETEIMHLTKLAIDNRKFAQPIFDIIWSHFQRVSFDKKLPCLYLIDSVIKSSHSKSYVQLFTPHITDIFCSTFIKADKQTRKILFRVRKNWSTKFPNALLYDLDLQVKNMDPAWPLPATDKSTSENSQQLSKPAKPSPGATKAYSTNHQPSSKPTSRDISKVGKPNSPCVPTPATRSLADIPKPYLPPVRRVNMEQFYWAASLVYVKPLSERKQITSFPKQEHEADEMVRPAKRRRIEQELPPARHSQASLHSINPAPLYIKNLLQKESALTAYMFEKKMPRYQKMSLEREFAMCNHAKSEYYRRKQRRVLTG